VELCPTGRFEGTVRKRRGRTSPTSPQTSLLGQIADYHFKASDKHFYWMAVNIPRTAPFCETGCTKNTLKASHNDSVPKGVNDREGNNVEGLPEF